MIEEKNMIDGDKPRTRKALCIAVAVALGALAGPAQADAIQDLKKEIEALQRKVEKLEKKEDAKAPSNAVTGGATPGSFKLPGSDTSVTLYGYVKFDANYSSASAGVNSVGDQALIPGLIPLSSAQANEKDQFKAHARQSRLGLRTHTPTGMGDLTTLLEMDFFGTIGTEANSNAHNPRIRHAVASLGGLSAGQTWTNFMFLPSYADTLDFGGHVGQIFVRQAQVRWTSKFKNGEWSVSLENPDAFLAVPGTATLFSADDDKVPDIVGRVNFGVGKGQLSVQGMARNVRLDSAAAPLSRDDKWGGAIGISGVFPTWGKDDFRFGVDAGNALGRYAGVSFFADGIVNAAGKLDLPNQYVWRGAYRHWWTDALRSSFVLSGGKSSNPAGTFAGVNREMRSAHLNLIWTPVSKVNVGAELIGARREVEGGASGSLTRLQFSAQYEF